MTSTTRALVVCMIVAIGTRVHAETDKEKAAALYREGKKLLDEGELEKACKKFEASERLVVAEGNRLNLADCWEKTGKTASAWDMFVKLAGSAKSEERAIEARRRAKELEPLLVRLTIQVESELEGLVITRNDQVIDRAEWNRPIPVDPDDYTITAKAEGREDWSKTISVKKKDKTIEVPELDKLADKPSPTKPLAASNRYRVLSLSFAAAGGVGIAIGTVFAVRSRTLENQSDQLCPRTRCLDQRGVDLNRRARKEGRYATLGLVAGAAAVTTAVVLWTVGRPHRRVSIAPVVTDDQAGVEVGGTF
jgi:hypothetical protein